MPQRPSQAVAADRRKMREVLRRLARTHGRPRWRSSGSAVDGLVVTILSQNTSDANSSAGFARLKERFATWGAAADARTSQIERCIRVSGLSRTKAPRIRRILRQIRGAHGSIDLEFLKDKSPEDAFDYLTAFDGVGPKTALCVLLFSFGKAVFPVDTHIERIAHRLGVLAEDVPFARAHEVLTPRIVPRDRHATHILLIRHGRRVCRARNPLCERCVILELCPTGRERLHLVP